jgi:hypothetical protein
MAKRPPNTPKKHDRCIRRGKPDVQGEVIKVDAVTHSSWVTVKWDGVKQTMLCDLRELQKI